MGDKMITSEPHGYLKHIGTSTNQPSALQPIRGQESHRSVTQNGGGKQPRPSHAVYNAKQDIYSTTTPHKHAGHQPITFTPLDSCHHPGQGRHYYVPFNADINPPPPNIPAHVQGCHLSSLPRDPFPLFYWQLLILAMEKGFGLSH